MNNWNELLSALTSLINPPRSCTLILLIVVLDRCAEELGILSVAALDPSLGSQKKPLCAGKTTNRVGKPRWEDFISMRTGGLAFCCKEGPLPL
jgi:hypothetical protein